jgi:hypothetical protein
MGDLDINQNTSSETPFQFAACRNAGRAILPADPLSSGSLMLPFARINRHADQRSALLKYAEQ